MQNTRIKDNRTVYIFIAALFFSAFGLGFSDGIISNYFKDAYDVTTVQRGFLEIPRELPGFLCIFLMSFLSFISDTKKMIISQILVIIGMAFLGVFTPHFYVMSVFLFIFSCGTHLMFPLQDSIGMGLSEEDKMGSRMGQFTAVRTAASMIAGVITFIGFRYGWFSFTAQIKLPFVISVALVLCSFVLYSMLDRKTGHALKPQRASINLRVALKKKYGIYYAFSLARGFHNQILFVYAPWILIEMMNKKADTLSILNTAGALAGVLFLPLVGKLMDRIGTKKLLFAESAAFIVIYGAYALISDALNTGAVASTALFAMIFVSGFYILDRMFALMLIVRSVYVQSLVSDRAELTQVLATGLSLDHVVSVSFAFLGGLIWSNWGPQYVFWLACSSSVFTLILTFFIKPLKESPANG